MRPLASLVVGICVVALATSAHAALVVQSVITNVAEDDLTGVSKFDVEIRAGVDAGALEAFGFSLQLDSSVAPSSVTEMSITNNAGWRDPNFEYLSPTSIASPNVLIEAELSALVAPPAKLIDFGVGAPEALIAKYQFEFSRPVGFDLPVTFGITPVAFSGNQDTPNTETGFIQSSIGGGLVRIDVFPDDYTSAQGVISGLTAVPEPSGLALASLGLVGLVVRRRVP